MIQFIKDYWFTKSLNKVNKSTRTTLDPVNSYSNIAILFDGTQEEDRKSVHRFKKTINRNGTKSIKSLTFLDNSLPLDNVDYAAYNKKNVNWYGIPTGEKIEEFLHSQFDLLIVLCKSMSPHFEYIIANSLSNFVIGPAISKSEKYFHLMVDFDSNEHDLAHLGKKIIQGIDLIAIKN